MPEYIVKVGNKGELYTPKKLRLAAEIMPGNELIATVRDHEIVLRKRKTVLDILDDEPIGTVTPKDLKRQRARLAHELAER